MKKHDRRFVVLITIFAILCFASFTFSAVPDVLKESFEYPEGDLLGQGESGNGWLGPWENQESGIVAVIGGTLGYEGLPQPGGYLEVSEAGTIYRYLEETWPDDGSTYWISLLYQRFDGHDVDDSYNGLSLFLNSAELLYIGKPWASKNVGLDATGISGGLPSDVDAYSLNWIVVKLAMNGTADNDRVYFWVNPDPTVEPDTSNADSSGNWNGSGGFNRFRIGSGNAPTPCESLYDEICMSKTFEGLTTDTDVAGKILFPQQFALQQNYPNPFNPVTTIAYSLEKTQNIRIDIYNPVGHHIRTLWSGIQNAGEHKLHWNGTDDYARLLPSGLYLYKLSTDERVETRKMMLLR